MRAVPRWLAVLAVVAIAAVVCAFTVRRALTPEPRCACSSPIATIPADGFTSTQLTIHSVERPRAARAGDTGSKSAWLCRGVNELGCPTLFAKRKGGSRIHNDRPRFGHCFAARRRAARRDEAARRCSRGSFRRRSSCRRPSTQATRSATAHRTFSACTILPTVRPSAAGSPCWPNRSITAAKPCREIDDCAALLRFAYREALREHNAAWAHAMLLPAPASAVDVQQYRYPYTPLAAALFRVRGGAFANRRPWRWCLRAICRRGHYPALQHVFRGTRFQPGPPGRPAVLSSGRPEDAVPRHDLPRPQPDRIRQRTARRLPHGAEWQRARRNPSLVGCRACELSGSPLASDSLQPSISRFLSLEHPAGRRLMRPNRAIVAVLLCCALVAPLGAQDQADTESFFSLASERTYLPGEKPVISVYSHNVSSLEFRVYRINDAVKFFGQMQELHSFGGRGPAMPKQAHTWLEKFHAWKHRIWAWFRDFIRAQFSPESRHKIRLWEMGGTKKQGPKVEGYAQVPILNQQQVVSVWKWAVPLARAMAEPDRQHPGQRQGCVPGRSHRWQAARVHHHRRKRNRNHHQSRVRPADELRRRSSQWRSDSGSDAPCLDRPAGSRSESHRPARVCWTHR